jgi:hypothetical protein
MLKLEGEFLRYDMNWLENIGAFGRDPKAKISSLHSVTRHQNPWTAEVLRGIRAPGTGFPFLIMLGTMWHRRGRDFCVVYKRKPVLILEFNGSGFKRWVIPDTKENLEVLRGAKPQVNLPE